jgi:aminoglycoside phosphotransferase (APT) family kinase protein
MASPGRRRRDRRLDEDLVRQPGEDRALYLRQLRATVATTFLPELTSATAVDAAGLVDRILAELIVEEECAEALSSEFGAEFAALLPPTGAPDDDVTAERFDGLRAAAADVVAQLGGSGDATDRELSRNLVDVERRFLERVEELRCAVFDERPTVTAGFTVTGTASSTDCSVTSEQLTGYLRRKFPASPDLAVSGMAVLPGGRSKETILVSLTGTCELPAEIIVRKDRPVGILQTRAADEFAVLRAIEAHGGVPVARPLFAEDRDAQLGPGTMLVMERVAGGKAGEYFPDLDAPTEHRRTLGEQLAVALAHLHAIPLGDLAQTSLDVEAEVTAATITASVEAMSSRIGELSGPPIAAIALARQWLVDHVADVVPAGRLCLLQSDVGLHNMLVDGDRITALVDWEAATVGPPARELATAWPAATALMDWPEFVAAYRGAGGPPEATNERAVTYYRVFFALGACMSSRTGGHLFRTGAKRDLVTAHSGLDAHFRAQRNLVRALEDAHALSSE